MRIGMMLRHYNQHGGGVRVYTHSLMRALLRLPSDHEYFLFYSDRSLLGTHGGSPGVTEVAVPAPSNFLWDQMTVPKLVKRYRIEVLYNCKYSIPLTANCPTAWVCHGLDWYVMPWASRRLDRLSHRYLVPRYARKADAIVAVSEVTKAHLLQFLPVVPERIHTIYSGVDDSFRAPIDVAMRQKLLQRYALPRRFVIYAGAIYPPKNFTRLVHAYATVGPQRGVSLVIAGGENRFLSAHELLEPDRLGLGSWVRWLGWVDPAHLPGLYQMSEGLLLPSLFESFGLPIAEAMAGGCPVLTADRYGTKEIAGDAAVLVNPESVESIAAGMARLLEDGALREELSAAGRVRMRDFTWERCARQTLTMLEGLVTSRVRSRATVVQTAG